MPGGADEQWEMGTGRRSEGPRKDPGTPTRGEERGQRGACPALAVFGQLWATAALLHILWPAVITADPVVTPGAGLLLGSLVLAAGAVMLRPASVWRLLSLAAVQVGDVVYHLPLVSNHWLLSGCVNLALLGAGASLWRRGGRGGCSRPPFMRRWRPACGRPSSCSTFSRSSTS